TFQEFFAAFYLRCQLIKKEISTNSIAANRKYRHELKEENKNVDEKLATALGASLQTEAILVSSVKVDETLA
ncbi:hypothetical protein pdam_00025933, partial [Pocillopora damicornis]